LDSVHYVLHRDVAARNFLVTRQSTVKLADFGRARYVYDDDYEASSAELISIKWAAPEASQEVFIGICWHHAACGTRSMVCEMVHCPFDLQQQIRRCQFAAVDPVGSRYHRLLQQQLANAGSATLSVYVIAFVSSALTLLDRLQKSIWPVKIE